MPPHERVGLHNRQQLPPGDDSRPKNKGNTGGVVGTLGPNLTLYVTGELFAEEQVLGRQLCARSKGRSQQPQDVRE